MREEFHKEVKGLSGRSKGHDSSALFFKDNIYS